MPEGTVDVIPVDLVAAAIITVAACGPERAPAIVQVASGSVNPLRYSALVDNIRSWFTAHPIYDNLGQPIAVPDGRSRAAARSRVSSRGPRTCSRAASGLCKRCRCGAGRPMVGPARRAPDDVERALSYVELYGSYAECEAVYRVDHLLGMWDDLDARDQATFASILASSTGPRT